jgi:hypothetical protein
MNAQMSDDLVKEFSLTKTQNMAVELGFVKPQNFLYIDNEEFTASLR